VLFVDLLKKYFPEIWWKSHNKSHPLKTTAIRPPLELDFIVLLGLL